MELPKKEQLTAITTEFIEMNLAHEKATAQLLLKARLLDLDLIEQSLDHERFVIEELSLLSEMVEEIFSPEDVETVNRKIFSLIIALVVAKTNDFKYEKYVTRKANVEKERKQAEAKAEALDDPNPPIKDYIDATIDKRFQKGPQKTKDGPKNNGKQNKKSNKAPDQKSNASTDPKVPKAPQAKDKKETSKKSSKTKKPTKKQTKKKQTKKKKTKTKK
jgi:hypothetical protein